MSILRLHSHVVARVAGGAACGRRDGTRSFVPWGMASRPVAQATLRGNPS
jgi:hypothetical protein